MWESEGMNREHLAETVADLAVQGEDDRKAAYIVDQLLSETRLDIGAMETAAADLIRKYDR